jgi:hypothetical protein
MLRARFVACALGLIGSLGAAVCAGMQQAGTAVEQPAPASTVPAAGSEPHAMTNADIVAMVKSHLDEATVVSAIEVNETQFDVSPQALIALKQAGLGDPVIAAMLESARRHEVKALAPSTPGAPPGPGAAAAAATGPVGLGVPTAPQQPPGVFPGGPAGMRALDPQTAAAMQAAMGRLQAMGYGSAVSMPFGGSAAQGSASAIHVCFLVGNEKQELIASYAQRAISKFRTGGPSAGGSLLRSIASQGLRFAAMGAGPEGMAAMSGVSMLGRFMPGMGPSRPSITYAWGLPGSHSERVLATAPAFELRYADIPGIDPDAYEPVLLHLVQTKDNYRLLGATRQKLGAGMGMVGMSGTGDWVAEDRVPAKLEKQGRGLYRLESSKPLAAGEYALVLRPVKGYKAQPTGFGNGEELASTAWDFSTALASR